MTTQTLEQAAVAYATGNHNSSFADTSDKKAFLAGAQFERDRLMNVVKEYCLSGNVIYPHRLLEKLEEMK